MQLMPAQKFFSVNEMCKHLIDVIVLLGHKDYGTVANRRLLVSIACVSRTLSAFALDALWATLDDLRPLVRLLPEDSCKYGRDRANIVSSRSLFSALVVSV